MDGRIVDEHRGATVVVRVAGVNTPFEGRVVSSRADHIEHGVVRLSLSTEPGGIVIDVAQVATLQQAPL